MLSITNENIKVASFQLRHTGWWEVRFLDEQGNPIPTYTVAIFSNKITDSAVGREWVSIYWPATKWGAGRIVKKFLSGKTRRKETLKRETFANHVANAKIYTYGLD